MATTCLVPASHTWHTVPAGRRSRIVEFRYMPMHSTSRQTSRECEATYVHMHDSQIEMCIPVPQLSCCLEVSECCLMTLLNSSAREVHVPKTIEPQRVLLRC